LTTTGWARDIGLKYGIDDSHPNGLGNMAEITNLDIEQVLDDIIKVMPPLAAQQQCVSLIEKMVVQGVPKDQALQFVFEQQEKH